MTTHEPIAYVREKMAEQKAPPPTSVGILGWIRANLFPDLVSGILTVVALFIVYSLVSGLLPWLLHGVWNASSLDECRKIIAERYGEGASGACWAVIHERFWQLMYGFYPSHLYWRPNLAFVLLLLGIAPVLFDNLPRKMLLITIAVPFVGPWLLWGGSVWVPIMVFLGFVIGIMVNRFVGRMSGALVGIIVGVLAAVVWWLFLSGPAADLVQSIIPLSIEPVASRNFGGFMLAITLGITGIAMSFPLGIFLALGRQSNLVILKTMSVGFIEFIRGVPLITLLFVASVLLNYFLPKGTEFDIILRVMIMITIFSAAYMAEAIRGGLAALPKGQYEAADALGLDYWQAQRLIIMPQALKIAIPSIVSIFIGLFKDTTLVSIIGLSDPIGWVKLIQANAEWNGIVWELYGFVAFVFFLFCFSMGRYSMYLERKLQTGH